MRLNTSSMRRDGLLAAGLMLLMAFAMVETRAASRGYYITPEELQEIAAKASQGKEPYKSAYDQVLAYAQQGWSFAVDAYETCDGADDPAWNDNTGGVPVVWSKALAYHLTGDSRYAAEVKQILETVMSGVLQIQESSRQCQLNMAWGIPEFVASADLIEDYWNGMSCRGPASTVYGENGITSGSCKPLFQNWLVKNPYYIVSINEGLDNWATAAAVTTGFIADYLWDRPEVRIVHRNPSYKNGGNAYAFSPAEAYQHVRQTMLDGMNGYVVSYGSSRSCDLMSDSPDQDPALGPPVKSQITENGINPADARRDEKCNIQRYNGSYQNYPQLAIDNLALYCSFLTRRGDTSCFDNRALNDLPSYTFTDKNGKIWTTHLKPGRGSMERAINAIIIDANTEWKKKSGLTVAYRYYYLGKQLPETDLSRWAQYVVQKGAGDCSQGVCFGGLTHGFAPDETPGPPPTVPPPGKDSSASPPEEVTVAEVESPYPAITSFSPEQGPAGTEVVIQGASFSGLESVDFNGTVATRVSLVSDSEVRAIVPSGASSGPIRVTTSNGSVSSADPYQVVVVRVTKTVAASADARVSDRRETTAYGTTDHLRVRTGSDGWKSYVKFQLSGIEGVIRRAQLRLFVTDSSDSGGELVVTHSDWNEETVTWATAPATLRSLGDVGEVVAGSWLVVDVTAEITGNGTFSFGLLAVSNNSVLYSSREGANPPELLLDIDQ